MPTGKTRERAERRAKDAAEIGPKDEQRLRKGMNKSTSSAKRRANKQDNLSSGKRDGSPTGSSSRGLTSTSGTKRHASAGASPAEPTARRATAKRVAAKR